MTDCMWKSCDSQRPLWGVGEVVRLGPERGRGTSRGKLGFVEHLVTDDHGACIHDPLLVVRTFDGTFHDGVWPEELHRVRPLSLSKKSSDDFGVGREAGPAVHGGIEQVPSPRAQHHLSAGDGAKQPCTHARNEANKD